MHPARCQTNAFSLSAISNQSKSTNLIVKTNQNPLIDCQHRSKYYKSVLLSLTSLKNDVLYQQCVKLIVPSMSDAKNILKVPSGLLKDTKNLKKSSSIVIQRKAFNNHWLISTNLDTNRTSSFILYTPECTILLFLLLVIDSFLLYHYYLTISSLW